MVSSDQISRSREVQKKTGKTFYFATLLLPKRVRYATHILYAFFRIADEVVDVSEDKSPRIKLEELNSIQDISLGISFSDEPCLKAFEELRRKYEIPNSEIVAFLDSMRCDIHTNRYDTVEEVDQYMKGSAVTVAKMMIAIMKGNGIEGIEESSAAMGNAFQLTNFLRDVREDITEFDRVYIPRVTLEKYGIGYEDVEKLEFSNAFAKVMQEELTRAEKFYREGIKGIKFLPTDCQFAILLSAILYAEHHRLIKEYKYDVLSHRPTLSIFNKISCLIRGGLYWKCTGDPEATFYLTTGMSSGVNREDGTVSTLFSQSTRSLIFCRIVNHFDNIKRVVIDSQKKRIFRGKIWQKW